MTPDMRGPVRAPVIAVSGQFAYVLRPLPGSITVPSSGLVPSTRTRNALVGAIETREGEFSGDFGDVERQRTQSSQFWGFLVAIVIALAAFISGAGITQVKSDERKALLIASVVYSGSCGLILYNMARHFEVQIFGYYGTAFFGVLRELAESLSPLLLILIGAAMAGSAFFQPDCVWRRLSAVLGIATLLGAAAVLTAAMSRDEVEIIVDNASNAPSSVAVNGLRLGTLPARTHARVTLCLGSRLHPRPGSAAFDVRTAQGSPVTTRIDLQSTRSGLLLLNIGNINDYRVVQATYQ